MGDPVKQEAQELGTRPHLVKWDGGDWERVVEAAKVLSAREHMDLNPTDIIRSGTRRFVDEILGQTPSSLKVG